MTIETWFFHRNADDCFAAQGCETDARELLRRLNADRTVMLYGVRRIKMRPYRGSNARPPRLTRKIADELGKLTKETTP